MFIPATVGTESARNLDATLPEPEDPRAGRFRGSAMCAASAEFCGSRSRVRPAQPAPASAASSLWGAAYRSARSPPVDAQRHRWALYQDGGMPWPRMEPIVTARCSLEPLSPAHAQVMVDVLADARLYE